MLIVFCVTNIHAKDMTFYAPEADVTVWFNNDNSIAIVKQVVRFQKYNSFYIYKVTTNGNGDLSLMGVSEIKEASPKDNYVDKQIPADVTISGLSTDYPRISGKFNSSLKEDIGSANDRHWEMARSLVFYNDNQELFSPDSVANLSTSASALVPSYKEIIIQAKKDTKQLKATHELKTIKRNSWGVFPLFIPFLLGIILYQLYFRNNSDPRYLKWIALNEIVGLILIATAFLHFYTYWWLIVLGVLATLGIQVTNLYYIMHIRHVITYDMHRKVPKWQSIVFGYVSMLCIPSIITIAILPFIPDITYTINSEVIIGLIASMAIVIGLYFWYRGCIKKYVPELEKHTLPIAVIVCFGAVAILALIIIIIAYVMFKGTGKALLNESGSIPNASLGRANDAEHSCSRCGRLGDPSCPYFKDQGTATSSCSSWIPD